MDLVFTAPLPPETRLRAAIRDAHRQDETAADARILAAADMPPEARERIAVTARRLVDTVRRERLGKGGLDAFLHEYALSSPEGVAAMPSSRTRARLLRLSSPPPRFRPRRAIASPRSLVASSKRSAASASARAGSTRFCTNTRYPRPRGSR